MTNTWAAITKRRGFREDKSCTKILKNFFVAAFRHPHLTKYQEFSYHEFSHLLLQCHQVRIIEGNDGCGTQLEFNFQTKKPSREQNIPCK